MSESVALTSWEGKGGGEATPQGARRGRAEAERGREGRGGTGQKGEQPVSCSNNLGLSYLPSPTTTTRPRDTPVPQPYDGVPPAVTPTSASRGAHPRGPREEEAQGLAGLCEEVVSRDGGGTARLEENDASITTSSPRGRDTRTAVAMEGAYADTSACILNPLTCILYSPPASS